MSGKPWPRVVFFGDSHTERCFCADAGWGSAIADQLRTTCDVIKRGFGGYNSRWCRALLPRLFSSDNSQDIAAFTVMLGSNDAESYPRQHVPLAEFKDNLHAIIDYMVNIGVGKEKIIVITPPPCDVTKWQEYCNSEGHPCGQDNQYNEAIARYATACCQVAEESGVSVIELYHRLLGHGDWRGLLSDGIHFSPPGARIVSDLVWAEVAPRVAHLPEAFPDWEEVDVNNPEVSFQ